MVTVYYKDGKTSTMPMITVKMPDGRYLTVHSGKVVINKR